MIKLRGNGAKFSQAAADKGAVTIRLSTDAARPLALRPTEAFIVGDGPRPPGFGWYLTVDEWALGDTEDPVVVVPGAFAYLADGDVVRLIPESGIVRVLHRKAAPYNSFLLTERCNNYCLMCSQPPRNVDDSWIVDEILEALPLIDRSAQEICFSGGEPTLLEGRFFELVRAAKSYLPTTALHVLSNGRRFADEAFVRDLANIGHPDLVLGIPLYADLANVHDHVVQARSAYDETVRGILNLKRHGVGVEIRVVLQQQTVPRLAALATFIARNLTFVDHVAFMALEATGFTLANMDMLWLDPFNYQSELVEAVTIVDRAGIRASIYNLQLCILDVSIRRFARRSISDWKQEYLPVCSSCSARSGCAGFFSSGRPKYSEHLAPILEAA